MSLLPVEIKTTFEVFESLHPMEFHASKCRRWISKLDEADNQWSNAEWENNGTKEEEEEEEEEEETKKRMPMPRHRDLKRTTENGISQTVFYEECNLSRNPHIVILMQFYY